MQVLFLGARAVTSVARRLQALADPFENLAE